MSKKSKEEGIWIPKEILFNNNLDPTNKIILTKILSLHEKGNGCHASNNYFEKFLGISNSAVSKRISALEKSGLIKTEKIYDGKHCLGRIITKGEVESKPTDLQNKSLMKGIWVPKNILLNKDLDPKNKILLTHILSLAKLKDGCFASNQRFGELIGITKSSVSKRISSLTKAGYLQTKMIFKKENTTWRIISRGKITSQPSSSKNMSISQMNRGVLPEHLEGGSSVDIEVVPEEVGGISEMKPINTTNNTINNSTNNKKEISTAIKAEIIEIEEDIFNFSDFTNEKVEQDSAPVPRKPGEETSSGHMSVAEYMRRMGRPDRLKDIYNG